MNIPVVPVQIPASGKPFFQEYSIDRLDIKLHAPLIIERNLAYGNRFEVRWLLETYTRQQIIEWMHQSGVSRITWHRYHLWCFVYKIPVEKKPARIWPY